MAQTQTTATTASGKVSVGTHTSTPVGWISVVCVLTVLVVLSAWKLYGGKKLQQLTLSGRKARKSEYELVARRMDEEEDEV